jgi:hypothetical protein
LDDDDDDDDNDNGQMGRVIPLVRAPCVDLTGADSVLQHDDDEIELIDPPVQTRGRDSKKLSTAPTLPSVGATTAIDEVSSASRLHPLIVKRPRRHWITWLPA